MEHISKILKFEKTPEHRWFVDLPDWKGSKDDLEMVSGADTMLDIISQGSGEIFLGLSNSPTLFPQCTLELLEECFPPTFGANYLAKEINGVDYNLRVWLCDVTKFVFSGVFPKKIFIY
jgi:hypothetical protein